MNPHDCSGKIAADLRNLGILPCDTILVHSSLKSLGPVPGGIETVIQGLLQAIGTGGTLLMPALSWNVRPPEIFDVKSTPCIVGAIPEFFRQREGVSRSLHPTHSVCAVGRLTGEFLDDHRLDGTPCGPHSPFRKVAESNGKIVMLGCGLKPNTTMHALEEYVEPPYLFGPSRLYEIKDQQGHVYRKEYRVHGFTHHGYEQRYERVIELEEAGNFLSRGYVLQADTFVLQGLKFKTAVLKKLEQDPLFFVEAGVKP
jgi:aminoglycoside 3-N-acetyltransferase